MGGEIIKQFLIGLGFGVDEASLSKFNSSIASATKRVGLLYTAIQVAAAGIFATVAEISKGFEEMGYEYRLIQPAINKAILLRMELLKAYNAAGINLVKVVQESVKFNISLAKTKFAFEAIYKGTAAKFIPLLTKQMDVFRNQIYQNMPKIIDFLEKFVGVVFKAFETTWILGQRVWSILGRVYDFFRELHDATEGWSTIILGVIAVWKLLNLAFLATPLGAILAGLVAILALYDDFKVWQEGGQSFFNWGPVVPLINSVTQAVSTLWQVVKGLGASLFFVAQAITKALTGNFGGAFDSLVKALNSFNDAFYETIQLFKDLWDVSGRTGQAIVNGAQALFGSNIDTGNLNQPGSGAGGSRPLGATSIAGQQQTNQNVNQQTSITVQGSPDANSTAKAVASQQTNVNAQLVTNLRPVKK